MGRDVRRGQRPKTFMPIQRCILSRCMMGVKEKSNTTSLHRTSTLSAIWKDINTNYLMRYATSVVMTKQSRKAIQTLSRTPRMEINTRRKPPRSGKSLLLERIKVKFGCHSKQFMPTILSRLLSLSSPGDWKTNPLSLGG